MDSTSLSCFFPLSASSLEAWGRAQEECSAPHLPRPRAVRAVIARFLIGAIWRHQVQNLLYLIGWVSRHDTLWDLIANEG